MREKSARKTKGEKGRLVSSSVHGRSTAWGRGRETAAAAAAGVACCAGRAGDKMRILRVLAFPHPRAHPSER